MYDTTDELEAFFKAFFDIRRDRILGSGAFGLAVLAFDDTEQVQKVFKLPREPRTTDALKIEGKNLLKLEHLMSPHIIRLYKYGRVEVEWQGKREERYYLCLAFGGTSLRGKLGELRTQYDAAGNAFYRGSGKRLPVADALRISIEVCLGLEAAHGFKDSEVRIIHRDIKPENLLIDDETGAARITDFGISRVIDRSTGICSVAGTLLYMDPECFKGHAGPYSDLYSLGIVMYEMFTGELPFENFQSRVQGPPADPRKLNPEIPDELAKLILRSVENDLNRRYANASEMLGDLRRIAAALNPLPAQFTLVERLSPARFVCEEEANRRRVVVHLIETDATATDMARETATLEDLSIPAQLPALVPPLRHFRNEHMLGIVYPVPVGRPLVDVLRASAGPGAADATVTAWRGGASTGPDGSGPPVVDNAARLPALCESLARLCDTLAVAHARGVIHGALSPALIYGTDARTLSIHGIALGPVFRRRAPGAAGAVAHLAAFAHAISFMSPQMLAGSAPPAAADDVFSLGAIAYWLLTGHYHAPREAIERLSRGEAVAQGLRNPRELNPLITRRLAGLVVRATDFNVHNRPASVAEIAGVLRECRWPEDIVDTLVGDALDRYRQGESLEAYDLLERALDIDPGNAQVHFARGQIYLGSRDYKWAVEEFQKAADVEPGVEVFVHLGRCYAAWENRHTEAAEMFSAALRFGESAEVHHLLARSLRAAGRVPEALRQLRKAIAMETDESIRRHREALLQEWSSPVPPAGPAPETLPLGVKPE